MTYCVAIRVSDGLVFAADSRTSASFDDVRVHSKLHIFEHPGRVFALMSAGNLATTQALLARIERDAGDPDCAYSLRTVRHMFEAADYVGQTLSEAQRQVSDRAAQSGVNVETTLILGGQIEGEKPALYTVYPLGNWIATSPETPYMQIGESKYGKPILEHYIGPKTSLENAARCALVSLDSTIRSNISVGPPINLALIRNGEMKISQQLRLESDTPLFDQLRQEWERGLAQIFPQLPRFPWEVETQAAQQQQR